MYYKRSRDYLKVFSIHFTNQVHTHFTLAREKSGLLSCVWGFNCLYYMFILFLNFIFADQ